MPDAPALERVVSYLRRVSAPGVSGASITLDTEIYRDLFLYGDDLWALANWLHKEFGVAGPFPLTLYGPPERPFAKTISRLMALFGLKQPEYESLTVRSVLSVIESGKWPA